MGGRRQSGGADENSWPRFGQPRNHPTRFSRSFRQKSNAVQQRRSLLHFCCTPWSNASQVTGTGGRPPSWVVRHVATCGHACNAARCCTGIGSRAACCIAVAWCCRCHALQQATACLTNVSTGLQAKWEQGVRSMQQVAAMQQACVVAGCCKTKLSRRRRPPACCTLLHRRQADTLHAPSLRR